MAIKKLKSVQLARTDEELRDIFAFRYKVYTEEMGFEFPQSNIETKLLTDSDDEKALNFFIKNEDEEIVGVIKLFIFNEETMSEHIASRYAVRKFAEKIVPRGRMIISRFLVREDYRARSKVAWQLIQECYHQCERNLVPMVLIDCSPHLVKFYEALGFRRFHDNFEDPVLGYKVPMVILLQDVEYLRKVNSPIYIFARKRRDATDLDAWFKDTFPGFGDAILAGHFGHEKLLSNLSVQQPQLPASFSEISQKLKSSCVLNAKPGDSVIRQGEIGNEMYMILDGSVEVVFDRGEGRPRQLAILGAGEVFGELGFVMRVPRTSTVKALVHSELLMIAADKADHLVEAFPKESAQLFLELMRMLAKRFVDMHQTL